DSRHLAAAGPRLLSARQRTRHLRRRRRREIRPEPLRRSRFRPLLVVRQPGLPDGYVLAEPDRRDRSVWRTAAGGGVPGLHRRRYPRRTARSRARTSVLGDVQRRHALHPAAVDELAGLSGPPADPAGLDLGRHRGALPAARHGGNRMTPTPRRTALAVALAGLAHAGGIRVSHADPAPTETLTLEVAQDVQHESNLFRLPDGVDPFGDGRRDDLILASSARARFYRPVSLQRFVAD